jgi:hypothetical protein
MSLSAYIRYDHNGRIVPGGPIVTNNKPAVGNWQVVAEGTNVTLVGQLRAFVKLNRYNKPLAGSLFLGKSKPATGKWLEVNATYEGAVAPTTTTTTSTSTSTTSTTTTISSLYRISGQNATNACSGIGDAFFTNDAYGEAPNLCSNNYVTTTADLPFSIGSTVYVYSVPVGQYKSGIVEDVRLIRVLFGCTTC